jgi:hypothetical protein
MATLAKDGKVAGEEVKIAIRQGCRGRFGNQAAMTQAILSAGVFACSG